MNLFYDDVMVGRRQDGSPIYAKDLREELAREESMRSALSFGQAPEGFALVPVEPTTDMVEALKDRIGVTNRGGILNAGHALAAAIAAAPKGDSHE